MTKKEIIKKVTQIILAHAHPERIYLYGSQISGDSTLTSDIDIAYDDENSRFSELEEIKNEAEQIPTLLKIDIVNIAHAEERFKNRVKATGKVLYSSNKKLRTQDGLINFTRSLERFSSVVDRQEKIYEDGYSDIYLDLVVKRFEFTFEMSWKAIKRYLDFIGIGCINPRSCFKEAFAQGLIESETVWLEMIETRNLSSHTYSEDEIKEILDKLNLYNEAFTNLKKNIETHLGEGS
ncbi:MAG: HI0074 family nucleotidyltransferase substrate-binding subunit [Candidatus Aminicenantes bacterium]|nr:HI0074 family nucleotidyltransferase substrate-binding subunit [Candidatus Aminicenantes bacterium]